MFSTCLGFPPVGSQAGQMLKSTKCIIELFLNICIWYNVAIIGIFWTSRFCWRLSSILLWAFIGSRHGSRDCPRNGASQGTKGQGTSQASAWTWSSRRRLAQQWASGQSFCTDKPEVRDHNSNCWPLATSWKAFRALVCHNMPHPLNPTEGVIAGSQYMCYIGLMSLNCPSFNFPLSKSLSMCQGSQILLHLRPLRPQRFQDDAEAKRLAIEGNKARLAEMEREAYQKRKALQNTCSKSTDKAAEKVEKLRQVGSQEIFQDQPARTSAKTMPTSATTKPAGKGPRKLKGKGTCAKKGGKSKCKKATAKKKQHAGSKTASLKNPPKKALPPRQVPVVPLSEAPVVPTLGAPVGGATSKVKEESTGKAAATPARSQVAPPVTPLPAGQALPRSDTGELVRDMLNRAPTQEQISQLQPSSRTHRSRQNRPARTSLPRLLRPSQHESQGIQNFTAERWNFTEAWKARALFQHIVTSCVCVLLINVPRF